MSDREIPAMLNYSANTSLYCPTSGSTSGGYFRKAQDPFELGQFAQEQRIKSTPFDELYKQNLAAIKIQAEVERLEQKKKAMTEKQAARRIIRVFIVDPSEQVPLDKAVLYQGDEQLTDLTDEELFMEIGIKPMLDKHNDVRTETIDKKATAKAGRDVFLEPIRIRDLKMVVSTLAAF